MQGSFKPVIFPRVRGVVNLDTGTSFTVLIAKWARKKRINNPQTKQQRETHFKSLADFLGHDDGAKVTSQNIVAFEKHLATTPDPHRQAAPPEYGPWLSVELQGRLHRRRGAIPDRHESHG